jgi:hypothetical protein
LVHEFFVGSRIARHLRSFTNCPAFSLVHELPGIFAGTPPYPYASRWQHTTVGIWDFPVVRRRSTLGDVPI